MFGPKDTSLDNSGDYTGTVSVDEKGRLALVVGWKVIDLEDEVDGSKSKTEVWYGLNLKDGGLWATRERPVIIHNTVHEYLEMLESEI